jgi:hypothetical protein
MRTFEQARGKARAFASQLGFDRRLVDDRPDLTDLAGAKPVENVLGEPHSPAVDRQAEEQALRRAVEAQPARDMGRLGDQELDVEMKVRDFLKVALEHRTITGKAERPAVVADVVLDESLQKWPILPVKAGDIVAVEAGQGGFGHGRSFLPRNGWRTCGKRRLACIRGRRGTHAAAPSGLARSIRARSRGLFIASHRSVSISCWPASSGCSAEGEEEHAAIA